MRVASLLDRTERDHSSSYRSSSSLFDASSGRGGGATSISVTAKMLTMMSRQRVAAVRSSVFALFIASGVQSARLRKPKTIPTDIPEPRDVARERNVVQPRSVAGLRSKKRVVVLQIRNRA